MIPEKGRVRAKSIRLPKPHTVLYFYSNVNFGRLKHLSENKVILHYSTTYIVCKWDKMRLILSGFSALPHTLEHTLSFGPKSGNFIRRWPFFKRIPHLHSHYCQMSIAKLLECMCFVLWAQRTMAPLRYIAKFDKQAQYKERIKFCHLVTLPSQHTASRRTVGKWPVKRFLKHLIGGILFLPSRY